MKQIGLIIGVIALAGALMFLNAGIGKNAHSDGDDAAQSPSQTQSQPPARTAPPAPATAPSATVPAEQTLGDPATAKYKITVGWAYDSNNQAHPEALSQALDAVRQYAGTHKDAAVQIVNVDVPAEARSPAARAVAAPGIRINGKPLAGMNGNPGDQPMTPGQITDALKATVP